MNGTNGSGGIGVLDDLLSDLFEGLRVSNLDTLLLQEGNRLIKRPVLVDGCDGEDVCIGEEEGGQVARNSNDDEEGKGKTPSTMFSRS